MKIIPIALVLSLLCSPAMAQICTDYAKAVKVLAQKYHEKRIVTGITKQGYKYEMWVNQHTRSWTAFVVVTAVNELNKNIAMACPIASGDTFKTINLTGKDA